jgi:two-component system sensor kinase FixL
MAIWTVWHGDYGLHGLAKAVTAAISIATAAILLPQLPKLMALRSQKELEVLNNSLRLKIKEQEAAAEGFRDTEQQLRTFLQLAPEGILIVKSSGRILYSNDMLNTMFGHEPDELEGHSVAELIPERSRELVSPFHNDLYDDKLARSENGGAEFVAMRQDGSEFPIEIRISPILKGGIGNNGTVLATLRNITERKKKEEDTRKNLEQLAHVSRLNTVGQMAAGLAHELNQPLTAITSNLYTAMSIQRNKSNPDSELIEMMEENYDSALRAGQIIKSLRQLVRKKEGEKEVTNVNSLVQTSSNFIGAEAKARDVDISLNLEKSLPHTLADAVQLQQVIINIGRNAIEAFVGKKQNDRVLRIGTSLGENDMILVTVSDNGPGMDEEVQANLFQPYFTSKETGMGLGLSICRSIVESHGGELWLESGHTQGSLFQFTLPILTTKNQD